MRVLKTSQQYVSQLVFNPFVWFDLLGKELKINGMGGDVFLNHFNVMSSSRGLVKIFFASYDL